MKKSKHVIGKTVFQVQLPHEQVDWDSLSRLFHEELVPGIEAALDAYAKDGQYYRLDRVEIDLGKIALTQNDKILPQRCERALKAVLPLQDDVLPAGASKPPGRGNRIWRVLGSYLVQGRFPWWSTYRKWNDLEEAIAGILQQDGEKEATEHRQGLEADKDLQELIKLLILRAAARQRLLQQASTSLLLQLLPRLREVGGQRSRQQGRYPQPAKPADPLSWMKEPLARRMDHLRQYLSADGQGATGSPSERAEQPQQPMPVEEAMKPAEAAKGNDDQAPGFVVSTAGLILLHPFLPYFFKGLGLWQDGQFVGPTAQSQAIRLLYHVAYGREARVEEHELVVAKLLCGYPLEAPIDTESPLDAEVWPEVTALLEAVIQQWEKLGNTGIDNFRTSFLHRTGILSRGEQGWQLRMEQQAFDMLLDYLPWNIAIIKLPWMDQALHVDWA